MITSELLTLLLIAHTIFNLNHCLGLYPIQSFSLDDGVMLVSSDFIGVVDSALEVVIFSSSGGFVEIESLLTLIKKALIAILL